MNYRHKLLNQQNKNQISQLTQAWQQEKNILQQDIINLQNSTDLKLLEQAQAEAKKLQKLLDDTVNLLGSSDIKNLTDLSDLLQGKTLKELATEKDLYQQKIKEQGSALFNLAKQKIKGQKEAEKLLNELETNFSKERMENEVEKENHARQLAKNQEITTNLEKELKELAQQNKILIENDDKLSKEKDKLVLEKNELNQVREEQLRQINLLFDEKAKDYKTIDFNGLYEALKGIAERERERAKT